jgi:hypothetical protein
LDDLDSIIDLLAKCRQRATYGAVAGHLGRIARSLMQGREKTPSNSWVVSQATGLPTDYDSGQIDPRLHDGPRALTTREDLQKWLEVYSTTEPFSLWDCLHDADLHALTSNPLERTVTLTFETDHLWQHAGIDPAPASRWTIHGVSHALANRWVLWPGPPPEMKNLPYAQQSDLVRDYQSKGRTVSVSWDEFESQITAHALCVANAGLTPSESGVTLTAGGEAYAWDAYCELEIRGERVVCERTDGVEFSLVDLVRMGEAYWEDFSKRSAAEEESSS